ncbi:unnamed protein product [Lupinus luteus]|uniref:Ubiquitin-like domain-containing protein n=1 Tax=Lupinus luteus TaxID=3873 RepID=A0AAV1VXS8_LUPLU
MENVTSVPLQQQQLLFNGSEVRNSDKLSALGIKDGDLLMMVSGAGASSGSTDDIRVNADGSAANPGTFQQRIKRDSDLLGRLFQNDPELAQAILGNDLNRLQETLRMRHRQRDEFKRQKEEELALLYADPFDVEAQKTIEAAIRQKGIDENWEAALEHNPEAFARVAFVDSGAQSTIISKSCAERLGLLRLLDQRYKGIAHGVGQSEILGGIHVAPIKVMFLQAKENFMLPLSRPSYFLLVLVNSDNIFKLSVDVYPGERSYSVQKDIPSRLLDDEKYAKEASSSGYIWDQQSITRRTCFRLVLEIG